MILWIDDLRQPPCDMRYEWVTSVRDAITLIEKREVEGVPYEWIDTDHDAGDFGPPDYIKVLEWLELTNRNYPIRVHSMNVVGAQNMRAIIEKNGWKEIW